MIKVLAFLGNPGREYSKNRHNVAWQFLENLAIYPLLRWQKGFKGTWAHYDNINGRSYFIRPETYMNTSGKAVAEVLKFYKINPSELLVVHDELEFGFGYFGFKSGGGLGGHNGLRSLKDMIGTADFMRLRFGIGRPEHDDISGYVLSDFNKNEKTALEEAVFPLAEKALSICLDKGIEELLVSERKTNALSAYNTF